MSMETGQFELVLEGAKDNSPATQQNILEVLSSKGGFKIFEVDRLLASGAVSLFSASTADELNGLRYVLSKAGGKVQIVRSTRPTATSAYVETPQNDKTLKGFYHKYIVKFSRILESVDLGP